MKATLWQRLNQMACNLVPLLLILGLVVISVVPVRLPHYVDVAPMLTVIGVGYWSIVRPDLMRPSFAFGCGVFADLLSGTLLGVNAFVLLCVHAMLASQRRFFLGKSFLVWWWAFALVALAAVSLKWLLFAAAVDAIIPLDRVLFSYVITVLIYPLWGRLFSRLEVVLVREG